MDITFRHVARGPAWDRWVIVEDQRGDSAFAGEVVMTYSDTTSYAEMECNVLFARDINEEETDQLLSDLTSILTGEGNVSIFSARQVACRGFSLLDEDFEGEEEEEGEGI